MHAKKIGMHLRTMMPALIWFFLFPLWQNFSYSHITHDKWIGMLILTVASLVMIVTGAILCRSLPHPCFAMGPALLFFALLGLAALFGSYAGQLNKDGLPAVWAGAGRYEGMSTQLCYLAIFLLLCLQPVSLSVFLNGASAALLIFCGIVALQYAGLNPFGLYPVGRSIYTNYEFQGTIGNIDMISGYLSLVVPVLMAGWALIRKHICRLLWLIASLLGVMLLLCMDVQGGFVTLGMMLLFLLFTFFHNPDSRTAICDYAAGVLLCISIRQCIRLPWLMESEQLCLVLPGTAAITALAAALLLIFGRFLLCRRGCRTVFSLRVPLLLTVLLLVLSLLLIVILPVPENAGSLWELHEILCGRPQSDFANFRLGVWARTLEMIPHQPLLGTGPDTFYYAMQDHLQATAQTLPRSFDNPHNDFLAILSNGGILSLLCYLFLLASVLTAALRKGGSESRILAAGCLCYLTQSFFSFSICLVSPMFWALLGMTAAVSRK